MKELTPPDSMFLEAAEGWLELGDYLSANEELENIAPSLRSHPDVLEMRCRVYSKAEKWDRVLVISETLCKIDEQDPSAWEHHVEALHRTGKTVAALELMNSVTERFPDCPGFCYEAARYAASIGDLEAARGWLEKCFERDFTKTFKAEALEYPGFAKIWSD